jgi:predicted DNA-binding protein (MmcQ/YjbR family)
MATTPLAQMRRICLALPDATETLTWGQPHFRVKGKIFAGFGDHGGKPTIGFKLEREHADVVIQDSRFERAPYVGAHGWVSMDVSRVRDWDEVRAFLVESYRLIAPKGSWVAFQAGGAAGLKRLRAKAQPRSKEPAIRRRNRRCG